MALLCGSEGGMQRAVMCSYDWTTSTLYRETVLRMGDQSSREDVASWQDQIRHEAAAEDCQTD